MYKKGKRGLMPHTMKNWTFFGFCDKIHVELEYFKGNFSAIT